MALARMLPIELISVDSAQVYRGLNIGTAKPTAAERVAVLDTAGQLVAFERMDNTQTASTMIAQDKGASAAMYRRPTKVFQDLVAGGGVGLRVLQLRGAIAVEGGIPLYVDGKIIGAIGVSGGSSEQDGVVAKAGQESMLK